MTAAVLLDTSYLISLVDATRPNHQIATRYFRQMLDESLPIYFSAVVAAEFGIKQALTDLPLQKFRHLPFNIPHGQRAAQLWNALGPRGDGTGAQLRVMTSNSLPRLVTSAFPLSSMRTLPRCTNTANGYARLAYARCVPSSWPAVMTPQPSEWMVSKDST